jgi:hypothetical protein
MIIANGSTDVTQYFVLRDSTTHAPKTDVTITDIDLYYLEQGSAISAKVDATALDAADSAHADNKAFHCGQGMYRIDWPDAAFDGGIGKRVFLIVVCSGVDTSYLEIELSPAANVKAISDDATAADVMELFAEALDQSTGQVDSGSIAANAITATAIQDGAITNAKVADDVDVNTKTITAGAISATTFAANALDAVWSTAARTLTAISDSSGVTTLLSRIVGTLLAGNHTAQTGDSYARLGAPAGASVSADVAAVKEDTGTTLPATLTTILADTNEVQAELADGGRTDLLIDGIAAKTTNLPASPAAVGSAMTLTSAYDAAKTAAPTVAQIRTELFTRSVTNDQAAAEEDSLITLILAGFHSSVAAGVWTIYRTDDITPHATKTVTSDSGADPITGVS